MKTLRLLATNTIAQMIGKVATVASTLLIGRMIADPQGLGKVGFDQYAIIVAYAAYFYIVTDFGFNAVAAKEISEDDSKTQAYVSNLLSMRLVLSVVLMMVGLAALSFIQYSPTVKMGIIIFLCTIITQSIVTNGNVLFQARLRYIQSAIAVIVGSLVSLALSFIVYQSGGNLYGFLGALIAGSTTMAVISIIQVKAAIPLTLSFDWPLWRHLVVAALPLGITIVLNLLYIRSGFFITSIVDEQNYGIYTMAYRIFDAVLVLPVFMVNSLYPIMVKRLQEGRQPFSRLLVKALFGMVAASIVVLVSVWMIAPWAIALSSGNTSFEPAIEALRWLSLLVPLFFVSNILLWAKETSEPTMTAMAD
jgi:O-antigen/teichoic acid export membrane protein